MCVALCEVAAGLEVALMISEVSKINIIGVHDFFQQARVPLACEAVSWPV
jgi:hypothetical protein